MHPNPIFRGQADAKNLDFARAMGFGALVVSQDGAPLISHIPFLLNDEGTEAELHLVRSNPMARLGGDVIAKLVVTGPHSYISPDWYGIPDQVPTWNYVAVHLTGALERLPDAELHGVLDRLSERFETELAPKPAWHSAKMTAGVMDRMMRQIVPFRLRITAVEGTWKLNQNKANEARLRAAEHVARNGLGSELAALAQMMRDALTAE